MDTPVETLLEFFPKKPKSEDFILSSWNVPVVCMSQLLKRQGDLSTDGKVKCSNRHFEYLFNFSVKMYMRMRSSVKSLIHKSWRNDITWSEPILKALALAFAFAAWGLTLDLYQHMVTENKVC